METTTRTIRRKKSNTDSAGTAASEAANTASPPAEAPSTRRLRTSACRRAARGERGSRSRVRIGALLLGFGLSFSLLTPPARGEQEPPAEFRRAIRLFLDPSPQRQSEGEKLLRAMGSKAVPHLQGWLARQEGELERVRSLSYQLGAGPGDESEVLAAARPFLSFQAAQAWSRFNEGQHEEAKRQAEAVLKLDPTSPEIWPLRRLIRLCEERLIARGLLQPSIEFRRQVYGLDETPKAIFRLINHSRGAVAVRAERGILGHLQLTAEFRFMDGSVRREEKTVPLGTDPGVEQISIEAGGSHDREIPLPIEGLRPTRGVVVRLRAVGKFQPSQWGVEEVIVSRTLNLPPSECWLVPSGEKPDAGRPLQKLESAILLYDLHAFFVGGWLTVWAGEDDLLLNERLLKSLVECLASLDETGIGVADSLLTAATGVKRDRKENGVEAVVRHWKGWWEERRKRGPGAEGRREPAAGIPRSMRRRSRPSRQRAWDGGAGCPTAAENRRSISFPSR